ncbi:hypothetical protein SDC9_78105 [bioreactor metagenome]|uniref:Uncharacterized protein n=1 Tax=bioreactor metagenome TaxID=1076179 RepID=A0A644YSM7_9ZZZZ
MGVSVLRTQRTYTQEEYNKLKKELDIMTDKYNHARAQYEIAKMALTNNGDTRILQNLLAEIEALPYVLDEKHWLEDLYVKYPYYKEIKTHVANGITRVSEIVRLTGVSKSAVYRALHDMRLFPLGAVK